MRRRTRVAPAPPAPAEYSSPPCYLHELSPELIAPSKPAVETAPAMETGLNGWDAIRAWRKETRDRLIEQRMALASHVRRARGSLASQRLTESVNLTRYPTLGIYWPIKGEIDLRDLARKHLDRGGVVALPVVVSRGTPVEFWKWYPGIAMQRGLWNIPIPAVRELVRPDLLVIPLVGFDSNGYRLGYGGGYYDRTLAAATPRPFRVGIGYAEAELATIHPQAHDIPMNVIVTERRHICQNLANETDPSAGGVGRRVR